MRPNCPICNTPGVGDWKMDFIVPDGWTLPTSNTVLNCPACGMIWYDNDRTQEDYDRYYAERYGFDGSLDCSANRARLDELVRLTAYYAPRKNSLIVDFGGGDGYISTELKKRGYTNVHTVEVGDELPENIDFLICAEVLEHIHDVGEMVAKLCAHMQHTGKMLIELPDARRMVRVAGDAPLIDYQQKHINHFMPELVDRMFAGNNFYPEYSEAVHVTGHIAWLYRAIYERIPQHAYGTSECLVTGNMREMISKLLDIGNKPVIVWGCGDIAMHLLTKVKLNVMHYVDIDPAYRYATIQGRPVLDSPVGGFPIVVMAMGQRDGILHMIEERGLTNEVIII